MNVVKMREVADSLLNEGRYEEAYYIYDEIYNQVWIVLGFAQNGLNDFSQTFLGYGYKTNIDFRNAYTLKVVENICKKYLELDLLQTLNELTFTTYGHLQSICYSPAIASDLLPESVFNEFLILHTLILETESENWFRSIFKIATPLLEGNYLKKIRINLTDDNLKRSLIENAAKIKSTDWHNVNLTFLDYLFNSGDNTSLLYTSVFKVVGYHFNKKTHHKNNHNDSNSGKQKNSGQYEKYEKYEKYERYERFEKGSFDKEEHFESASATESEKSQYYGELLHLSGKVTKTQIRKNYLDLIAKYHPDKVYELGDELKILAEKKTKQLNTAYEWMKKRYSL